MKLDDIKKPQLSKIATATKQAAASIEKATDRLDGTVWNAVSKVTDTVIPYVEMPENPTLIQEGSKKTELAKAIQFATRVYNTAVTQCEVPESVTKHFKRHLANMLWARTLPQDTKVKDQDGKVYVLGEIANVGILQRTIADAKAQYGHASAAKKAKLKGPDQNRNDAAPEGEVKDAGNINGSGAEVASTTDHNKLKAMLKAALAYAEKANILHNVVNELGYALVPTDELHAMMDAVRQMDEERVNA